MIAKPAAERASEVVSATGLVKTGGTEISAMTLTGGTAATGATAVINDSTDGTGTDKWVLGAPQYGESSITFSKPIPLTTGLYVTLTGTAEQLSIAYT